MAAVSNFYCWVCTVRDQQAKSNARFFSMVEPIVVLDYQGLRYVAGG